METFSKQLGRLLLDEVQIIQRVPHQSLLA